MRYLRTLTAFASLVSAALAQNGAGQDGVTVAVPSNVYIGTPSTITVGSARGNITITLDKGTPGAGVVNIFSDVGVDANGDATLEWTPDASLAVGNDYSLQLTDTVGYGISAQFAINAASSAASSSYVASVSSASSASVASFASYAATETAPVQPNPTATSGLEGYLTLGPVPKDVYISTPVEISWTNSAVNVTVSLNKGSAGLTLLFDNGYSNPVTGAGSFEWTPDSSLTPDNNYWLEISNENQWVSSPYIIVHSALASPSTTTTAEPSTAPSSTTVASTSFISSNSASTSTLSASQNTTSIGKLTTSTVYATSLRTIYSCAASVTDCPARHRSAIVVTDTIALYTTVCPATQTAPAVPTITVVYVASPYANTTIPFVSSYTTTVVTVTSYPGGGAPVVISTVTTVVPCAAAPPSTTLLAGNWSSPATTTAKYTPLGTGAAVTTKPVYTGAAIRAAAGSAAGLAGLLGLVAYVL